MGQAVKPRAVVVDDDIHTVEFLCDILQEGGFEVLSANSGDEGLKLLETWQSEISLVIADVRMPGQIDGLTLVQLARSKYPAIRSFLISGDSNLQAACQAGANGYLAKPFSAEQLLGLAKLALAQGD